MSERLRTERYKINVQQSNLSLNKRFYIIILHKKHKFAERLTKIGTLTN